MPARTAIHQSYSASNILSGPGSSASVGELLAGWAVDRTSTVALIVDPDVYMLGLTATVQEAIGAEGFRVAVVACERGEPKLAWVERVVAEIRALHPAACVGVGGGSTMDIAKLAAALVHNTGEVTDYLGLGKVHHASVPTVMIPTTAGTGSETTQVSMLSSGGKKVVVASAPLVPRGAILDPQLTVGLPEGVTAASGLDALSHGIESYLSTKANGVSMGASLYGAQLVADSLVNATQQPSDLDARMGMLTGAFWAGVGLNASVVLGHSIAYTIANRTGLPHGVTCAMALPYCMAYNETASHKRIGQISSALRNQVGEDSGGASPAPIYTWLDGLFTQLNIPRGLNEVGVTKKDVPALVTECIESYPRANNPVPFEAKRLSELYGYMFDGDVLGCVKAFHIDEKEVDDR